jgi:glycine cleavage system regulatory protein
MEIPVLKQLTLNWPTAICTVSMMHMKDVMLTLIGPDKTGIVAHLAAIAGKHDGNWLDSRMIRMDGYFSGIVRVSLPIETLSQFGKEVGQFMEQEGFQYAIQAAEPEVDQPQGNTAELELSGQDHPGIVHAIFDACKQNGINVEELTTGLQAAPWSGTPVFEAKARVRIPDTVSEDDLKASMEALAADLMVEVELK